MSKCLRLEQEIFVLRHELAAMRFDRDELYRKHGRHLKHCPGGSSCKRDTAQSDGKRNTKQENYIAYLEEEIERTRLKYQRQMGDVKSNAGLLERKLQSVRQEMNCITAKARQVDKLKKDIQLLKSKLQRRDSTIARYSQQESVFLGLIKNFEQIKSSQKEDNNNV